MSFDFKKNVDKTNIGLVKVYAQGIQGARGIQGEAGPSADTSSFLQNSITSSLVFNSSTSSFLQNAITSSLVFNSATESFLMASVTSSLVFLNITSSMSVSSSIVAETASYSPNYLPLTGGTISGDVFVTGVATVAVLKTLYTTSSIIYQSGSTKFGDTADDRHEITGSFLVSGSINPNNTTYLGVVSSGTTNVNGNLTVSGSLQFQIPASNGTYNGNITKIYTIGENVSFGDLLYIDSNGTWKKTNSNSSESYSRFLGIALETSTTGNSILTALPNSFLSSNGFSFNPGMQVFLGTSSGSMSSTPPSSSTHGVRVVGMAIDATTLFFNPSNDYLTLT